MFRATVKWLGKAASAQALAYRLLVAGTGFELAAVTRGRCGITRLARETTGIGTLHMIDIESPEQMRLGSSSRGLPVEFFASRGDELILCRITSAGIDRHLGHPPSDAARLEAARRAYPLIEEIARRKISSGRFAAEGVVEIGIADWPCP